MEKERKIQEVRDGLNQELQKKFDEYCSGRNPQLSKRLQDPNTNWEEVLNNWSKKKSFHKNEQTLSIVNIIDNIKSKVEIDTFDSLKDAMDSCDKLKVIISKKRDKKKKEKIKELEAQKSKVQAELDELQAE